MSCFRISSTSRSRHAYTGKSCRCCRSSCLLASKSALFFLGPCCVDGLARVPAPFCCCETPSSSSSDEYASVTTPLTVAAPLLSFRFFFLLVGAVAASVPSAAGVGVGAAVAVDVDAVDADVDAGTLSVQPFSVVKRRFLGFLPAFAAGDAGADADVVEGEARPFTPAFSGLAPCFSPLLLPGELATDALVRLPLLVVVVEDAADVGLLLLPVSYADGAGTALCCCCLSSTSESSESSKNRCCSFGAICAAFFAGVEQGQSLRAEGRPT